MELAEEIRHIAAQTVGPILRRPSSVNLQQMVMDEIRVPTPPPPPPRERYDYLTVHYPDGTVTRERVGGDALHCEQTVAILGASACGLQPRISLAVDPNYMLVYRADHDSGLNTPATFLLKSQMGKLRGPVICCPRRCVNSASVN
jgi:hypothetical protein